MRCGWTKCYDSRLKERLKKKKKKRGCCSLNNLTWGIKKCDQRAGIGKTPLLQGAVRFFLWRRKRGRRFARGKPWKKRMSGGGGVVDE